MQSIKGDYAVLYVAPDGNDKWSGDLTQANAEKNDGPLKTMAGARNRVRELQSTGQLVRPLTVQFRGGSYSLTEPVAFGPQDSANVTYAAYPGEQPVFDGGVRITGFTETKVNGVRALVTHLPDVEEGRWYFRQLWVDGARAPRTRLPKTNYYWMESLPGVPKEFRDGEQRLKAGTDCFIFKPGDLRQFKNLGDVDVLVNHFWVDERMPALSIDEGKRLFKSTVRSCLILLDDVKDVPSKYFVENTFEGLSAPGEWYLDRSDGKLYIIPRDGQTADTLEVIAPRLMQFITITGEPAVNKYVENIAFDGLTFQHADWYHTEPNSYKAPEMFVTRSFEDIAQNCASAPQGAIHVPGHIRLEGARHVRFANLTVAHAGMYAFELQQGSQRVSIHGCTLHDLGGGGIKQNGSDDPRRPELHTHGCSIERNHIHDCGNVFACGIGILLQHSYRNHVRNNHVHDMYYSGISVGWVWGFMDSVSRENVIEYNHIHHLGKTIMSDMGGIYLLGPQAGTVVRGNLVHDVERCNYGGWGIYLDEGSAFVIVENNVSYNTSSEAMFVHIGRELQIRNNIFGPSVDGQFSLANPKSPFYTRLQLDLPRSITLERNILVSDGSPFHIMGYAMEIGTKAYVSDLNLYHDYSVPAEKKANFIQKSKEKTYTIAQWRELGFDKHSLLVDPGLNNPRNGNFELAADSPALALGFVPFKFGVQESE